jgi:deazaflavin-dependent oxidoreductase (nitroreductase family)
MTRREQAFQQEQFTVTIHAVGRQPSIPSIVPILNPLIRRLLRLGMPMGPNALVTVRGRTSGEPHTFPAAVMEAAGRHYLIATFGEVNWVRNLRVTGQATVQRGRRSHLYLATELPPDEAAGALRAALAPLLRSRLTAPILRRWYGLDRTSSPDDYERAALAHPVFALVTATPH